MRRRLRAVIRVSTLVVPSNLVGISNVADPAGRAADALAVRKARAIRTT